MPGVRKPASDDRAPAGPFGARLPRGFFARDVETVARDLLGRVLADTGTIGDPGAVVGVRLTEVEAYAGVGDPASHAFRGRTARNEVMFGPPGHLYTYFVYGMHWCANIVTGPDGDASAVLLRAGEVVRGDATAALRRPATRPPMHRARGPAALAGVLGLDRDAYGADLVDGRWGLFAGTPTAAADVASGPRVGVAAGAEAALRFWDSASRAVSAYRSGTRATRAPRAARPR